MVERAVKQSRRNRYNRARPSRPSAPSISRLITVHPQMCGHHMIRRIADSNSPAGAGEVRNLQGACASALHRHSPRKNRPYRAINCAGLNENLLVNRAVRPRERRLPRRGRRPQGLFRGGGRGTQFLDEVGDKPLSINGQALRQRLENVEIHRSHNRARRVDVRVVAATRQDVRSMVEKGQFRTTCSTAEPGPPEPARPARSAARTTPARQATSSCGGSRPRQERTSNTPEASAG